VQAQLYSQKLESLLGMPPAEPGEDLNARRDERNRRISQVSDPETKARAQIILDRLGPVEAQLPKAEAEAPAALDQRSAQDEAMASRIRAAQRYPELADPNSELTRKYLEIASRLSTEGSPLVKAPDAAERIADMAAGELKIAPKQ